VIWGGVCLDHTLCHHMDLYSDQYSCDNERVFDPQDSAGVGIPKQFAGVGGGVEDND